MLFVFLYHKYNSLFLSLNPKKIKPWPPTLSVGNHYRVVQHHIPMVKGDLTTLVSFRDMGSKVILEEGVKAPFVEAVLKPLGRIDDAIWIQLGSEEA